MVSKQWLRAAGFAALAAAGVVRTRRNERVVALDDYRSARRTAEPPRSVDDHDWPSVVNTLLTRVEF